MMNSMSYLTGEAIYCLHKVIDYCQTFGISYMNSHSQIGSSYAKLATWAARHQAVIEYYQWVSQQADEDTADGAESKEEAQAVIQQATQDIQDRLSDTDRLSLRYNYNSEMALHHYWYAKELHNEGNAYKEQLESLYYLNDDFNDNRFHFSAAIERYWINTGVIDARIEKLQYNVTRSSLYHTDNYNR